MYNSWQQPQPPQPSGFIWVTGEDEAKNYLVAPNCAVALWDRTQQVIYVKTADASGMMTTKKLKYEIEDENGQHVNIGTKYVTQADMDALAERISKLEKGNQTV